MWLKEIRSRSDGVAPPVDLKSEKRTAEFVRQLVLEGVAVAVHDVSDGGLLVAVAEMCLAGDVGCDVNPDYGSDSTLTAEMFGEDQGRYLVAVRSDDERLPELAGLAGVPIRYVGYTGSADEKQIELGDFGSDGIVALADLRAAHEGFFPRLMGNELTPEF